MPVLTLRFRLRDLVRGLMQAGVDDLAASIAQRPSHHLGSPSVPVEARLGDEDPDRHGREATGPRVPRVPPRLAYRSPKYRPAVRQT